MSCCEPLGTQVSPPCCSSCTAALPEVLRMAVTPESHMVPGAAACKALPGYPQAAPGILKIDGTGKALFGQAQKMVTMLWFD